MSRNGFIDGVQGHGAGSLCCPVRLKARSRWRRNRHDGRRIRHETDGIVVGAPTDRPRRGWARREEERPRVESHGFGLYRGPGCEADIATQGGSLFPPPFFLHQASPCLREIGACHLQWGARTPGAEIDCLGLGSWICARRRYAGGGLALLPPCFWQAGYTWSQHSLLQCAWLWRE